MANLDTGLDLLTYVQRRAGDILPTAIVAGTDADHYPDTKLAIQQAYWALCKVKPWRWCRRRTQFNSIAPDTVTVVSIAGVTVTLAATLTPTRAGRKLFLEADGVPHRISAHTAGTDVLTLATAYTGAATGGGGTIFQDEIPVATDILAFPRVKELGNGDILTLLPEAELDTLHPRNINGTYRAFFGAFTDMGTLRIAPWTLEPRLFECAYNFRPLPLTFDGVAGTDTPVVPQEARQGIGDWALVQIYSDKEDARVEVAAQGVTAALNALSSTEISFGKPRTYVPAGQAVGHRTGRR